MPIGIRFGFACCGGPEGARTLDLTDANRALSQTVQFTPSVVGKDNIKMDNKNKANKNLVVIIPNGANFLLS